MKARADGKADIYVADGGNHEPLMNSNQGYERIDAAEKIARRLFGRDGNAEAIQQIRELIADASDGAQGIVPELRRILANLTPPEPVDLLNGRIRDSVRRRAPFMSEAAARDLAEDITENIADYLKGVFDL